MMGSDCRDFPLCMKQRGIFSVFFLLFLILLLSEIDLAAAQPGNQGQPDHTNNQFSRLSPAMAVIVIIFIAALFFMGFFSVYIRHCTGSRAADGSRPPAGSRSRRLVNAAARGLDASVIETFPTFIYSEVKTLKIGKGALECAVCLNEFEDDETLRLLPKCDHVFHPHCIGAWLEAHVTCPVCRSNLAEADAVQPDEATRRETDLEAQNDPELETVDTTVNQPQTERPRVLDLSGSLNRLRGSGSSRTLVKFQRWHSTGHSLVQPGQDTERFTLRLPVEVRKQIVANRELNRANSLVALPREGSTRKGKQVNSRLRVRSDRWLFLKTQSFHWRNPSVRSPKVVVNEDGGEGSSVLPVGMERSTGDSVRSDWRSFLKSPSFLWRNPSVRSPKVVANDGSREGSTVGSMGDSVRLPL